MNCELNIYRRARGESSGRFERFFYEPQSEGDTVATALTAINSHSEIRNADGEITRPVEWECSCLQKKCGACAMVINGRPRLACGAKLSEFGGSVVAEPLRKFPVVCDLAVDRSILYENLRTMKLWLYEDAEFSEKYDELVYRSSECLLCGCCLEVCPNFYAGGKFFGMAGVPITTRLLMQSDKESFKEIARGYRRHVFAGCGKSLSCRNVCPKGIDTEELLVNSNAVAVMRRKK